MVGRRCGEGGRRRSEAATVAAGAAATAVAAQSERHSWAPGVTGRWRSQRVTLSGDRPRRGVGGSGGQREGRPNGVVVMAEAVRAADARNLLWPPLAVHTVPAIARGDRGSWGSWGLQQRSGNGGGEGGKPSRARRRSSWRARPRSIPTCFSCSVRLQGGISR